jgi:hypothetical protein
MTEQYSTPEGTSATAGSASSIITTPASEETITDDTIQEIKYGELKELLQTVFEQGILRGIPTGQDTALELINNDPEIDTETKEYITNLVKGGNN